MVSTIRLKLCGMMYVFVRIVKKYRYNFVNSVAHLSIPVFVLRK